MFIGKVTEIALTVAAVAVTVGVGFYIHSHITWGCILGTCAVITH